MKLLQTLLEADRLGKKCSVCKQGTYQETSIHDDMDGLLHCNFCGEEVKRHSGKMKPATATAPMSVVERCAKAADEYWNSAALQKKYEWPGEYIKEKVKP